MNRNTTTIRTSALLCVLLASTACLQKETTHTIYLDPDGSIAWTVLEENVRSDEEDADRRLEEEQGYIESAWRTSHGVAAALEALGGRPVADLLRSERPFVVFTEARFFAIDRLARRFLEEAGIDGEAELRFEPQLTRFTLTCAQDAVDDLDEDGRVVALIEELDRYRLVLTRGRFVEARGFRLEDGDTVAIPLDSGEDGPAVYSLAWREEP